MGSRRDFLVQSAAAGAALTVPGLSACGSKPTDTSLSRHQGEGIPHWDANGGLYEVVSREHLVRTPTGSVGGVPAATPGALNYPVSLVIAADSFFVLELGNARVQRFSFRGRSEHRFGEYGGGPGQLRRPRDIAQGPDGLLYIADTLNHRVQVWSHDGRYLQAIGDADVLNGPRSVALDDKGDLHVASAAGARGGASVKIFSAQGRHLGSYGEGVLQSPRCIRFGLAENAYVADPVAGGVFSFDPNGSVVDTVLRVQRSVPRSPSWLSFHPTTGQLKTSSVA